MDFTIKTCVSVVFMVLLEMVSCHSGNEFKSICLRSSQVEPITIDSACGRILPCKDFNESNSNGPPREISIEMKQEEVLYIHLFHRKTFNGTNTIRQSFTKRRYKNTGAIIIEIPAASKKDWFLLYYEVFQLAGSLPNLGDWHYKECQLRQRLRQRSMNSVKKRPHILTSRFRENNSVNQRRKRQLSWTTTGPPPILTTRPTTFPFRTTIRLTTKTYLQTTRPVLPTKNKEDSKTTTVEGIDGVSSTTTKSTGQEVTTTVPTGGSTNTTFESTTAIDIETKPIQNVQTIIIVGGLAGILFITLILVIVICCFKGRCHCKGVGKGRKLSSQNFRSTSNPYDDIGELYSGASDDKENTYDDTLPLPGPGPRETSRTSQNALPNNGDKPIYGNTTLPEYRNVPTDKAYDNAGITMPIYGNNTEPYDDLQNVSAEMPVYGNVHSNHNLESNVKSGNDPLTRDHNNVNGYQGNQKHVYGNVSNNSGFESGSKANGLQRAPGTLDSPIMPQESPAETSGDAIYSEIDKSQKKSVRNKKFQSKKAMFEQFSGSENSIPRLNARKSGQILQFKETPETLQGNHVEGVAYAMVDTKPNRQSAVVIVDNDIYESLDEAPIIPER